MTLQAVQPYLSMIVQALVGLLTLFALTGIAIVRRKATAWLDARLTDTQRSTLHRVAGEAFALAEATMGAGAGPWKMTAASGYVAQRLQAMGISVSESEIRAAIEQAVLQYNAVAKKQSPAAGPSTDAPQRTDMANRAG